MAKALLENVPLPPNKYGIDSVNVFGKDLEITTKFQLKPATKDGVLKLLKSLKFPRKQVLIIFLEDSKRMVQLF